MGMLLRKHLNALPVSADRAVKVEQTNKSERLTRRKGEETKGTVRK